MTTSLTQGDHVVTYLTHEQRFEVYGLFMAKPITIYTYNFEFFHLFKPLVARDERTEFYERFKTELSKSIVKSNQFGDVMNFLTLDQRTDFYERLKTKLPTLIENGHQFGAVLLYLTPDQRTDVYERLKTKLPTLIENGRQFGNVMAFLTPDQCTDFYERLKTKLPTLIENGHQFDYVLLYLTPDQRTDVYERLRTNLPKLIKMPFELGCVLRNLTPEQRSTFYMSVKIELPRLFHERNNNINNRSFEDTLIHLNPEHCADFIIALTKILNKRMCYIIDMAINHDFDTSERRELIIESIKTALIENTKIKSLNLIASAPFFNQIMSLFNPKQQTALCVALINNRTILNLIKSDNARDMALSHFSFNQKKLIDFIKQVPESKASNAFISALLDHDSDKIKASLVMFVQEHQSLRTWVTGFWSQQHPSKTLVMAIVDLGPYWRNKISTALDLSYPEGRPLNSANFKMALEQHLHDESLVQTRQSLS